MSKTEAQRLRALVEAGVSLSSDLSLDTLLQRFVETAAELTAARYGALGVINRARTGLERFFTTGVSAEQRAAIGDLPQGRGILGLLIEHARPIRLASLADHERSVGFPANHPPMSSFLGAPIMLRDVAYGNFYLTEKQGASEFTPEDEDILTLLAAQAGAAIELSQRVARDAVRRVVAGQELERTRLARELHDETGQALTSILLGLRTLKEAPDLAAAIEEVRDLVVSTLQDVRRLAVELRPSALDDFGLVPALERLTATIDEQGGPSVDLHAELGDERLPKEIETALYRIVQEALTNALKHGDAQRISVVIRRTPRGVTTLVEDDGRGIAPGRDGEGLGLVGMRERLALLDGELLIESSADTGTTIAAEVPL